MKNKQTLGNLIKTQHYYNNLVTLNSQIRQGHAIKQ